MIVPSRAGGRAGSLPTADNLQLNQQGARMKIAVLGSTGATGHQILRQALDAGHHVTAVARGPDAVTDDHPNLHVRIGDVLEPASLEGAFDGAQAVLSALGSHSGRAPTYVYSHGMTNVRAEMSRAGFRRLLAISADPVSRPAEKSLLDRLIVHPLLHQFFGGTYDDLRRMETDLRSADDVDWTVFRPPRLRDGAATGTYRMAVEAPLSRAQFIRRADLAAAMLTAIDDPALTNKIVTIAS